jgi:hypothetical protein
MGRGQRARHEFVSQERPVPPPHQSIPEARLLSSSLRVIRKADTIPSINTEDWNRFLNDVGDCNLGNGTARSLGSVAVTLVPAKEMGLMLYGRYPDACRDPQKMARLHRKLRESINGFIDNSIRSAFHGQTQEMASAYALHSRDMLIAGFSDELEGDGLALDREPAEVLAMSRTILEDQVFPLADNPIPFHAGTFKASGVQLFGGGRYYAVDLSANQVLNEERHTLLSYLRDSEGLRTRSLEQDGWEPHGTVFDLADHIRSAVLGHRRQVPSEIGFQAVQAVIPPRAAAVHK